MVTELADDDVRDKARSGKAPVNRPLRRRRTRHPVFASATNKLGTHVLVHFQFGRLVLQDRGDVFSYLLLWLFATAADLLSRIAQVQIGRKSQKVLNASTGAAIPLPPPTRCQVNAVQQLDELGMFQLDTSYFPQVLR